MRGGFRFLFFWKKVFFETPYWAPAVILFLPGLLQIVEGVAHSENKNSLNAFIFWKIDSKPSTCTWFVCCNDTLCPTIQNICYRQPDDEVSNHNSESIWKYCSLRMRLSIKKSESIWKYFLQPEDIVINRKSRVGESVESALSALAANVSALCAYFNNFRQKILYFDVLRQKRVLFNCFATKQCLGMLKMWG